MAELDEAAAAAVPRPTPDANVSQSYSGADEGNFPGPAEGEDDPDGLMAMTDVMERAKNRWEYAKEQDDQNRLNHVADLKFAWERGEQWNADIRRQRETAKPRRPWLEFNQTSQFVKQIVNDQRQNRSAIKVRPAGGGATEKLADLRAGMIRGIEYHSKADAIYDSALEQAVTGGRGYWRVVTEYEKEDSFDQVLRLKSIADATNAILDPDATAPDKSDIEWGFVCDWVDKETYEKEWPEARNVVSWEAANDWSTFMYMGKVCVADYFEICEYDDVLVQTSDGLTMWQKDHEERMEKLQAALAATGEPFNAMLGQAILPTIKRQETRKRKRVDYYKISALPYPLAKYEWRGKYIPIVCVVGDEIVIEGRHIYQGIIRRLRDAQMMYNYWFTLATERLALAPKSPYVALAGQTENYPSWLNANTDAEAVLVYDPVKIGEQYFVTPPGRTEPIQIDAGLVTMLQLCAQNLREITGMKGAAVGDSPQGNQPYASLLDQQRRGDNATFHYGDNLSRGIQYGGKIIDDMIEHTYDAHRQVATLDPSGKKLDLQIINMKVPDQRDPTKTVTLNPMDVGDFDIAIETGPSYATRRVEAAEEMQEFMGAMGEQMAPLIADLYASMADWPGDVGDKIAARLHAMLPPQIQQMEADPNADPQVAQLQAAMQQQGQQFQQQAQQMQAGMAKMQQQVSELTFKLQKTELDRMQDQIKYANDSTEAQSKMAEIVVKNRDAIMRAESERRSDDMTLIGKRLDFVAKIVAVLAKDQGLGQDLGPLSEEAQREIERPVEPTIAGGPHTRTGQQAGAPSGGGQTSRDEARNLAAAVLMLHQRMNMMDASIQHLHSLSKRKRKLSVTYGPDGMPTGGESTVEEEPATPPAAPQQNTLQ